jgi:D-tyrosyl-tRNA(Tyr) deacylase
MRVLIQRVERAQVTINKKDKRLIGNGLLIFLGIENDDTTEDVNWLSAKISKLRIFDDNEGVMNNSLMDINGDAMVISLFTLHAKTRKGSRPSYIKAAKPDIAIPIYEEFIVRFSSEIRRNVVSGEFGAHMDVELINDGPVTIWIDTKNKE